MEGKIFTRLSLAIVISLLLFSTAQTCSAARAAPSLHNPSKAHAKSFIRSSCGGTAYPRLCLTSLSPHSDEIQASPAQLVQAALSVSLAAAKSALDGLSKISASASGDCMATVGDCAVQLQRSVDEMASYGRRKKNLRRLVSNVLTWVSTALTDASTCVVGFAEVGGVEEMAARGRVEELEKMTGNALSLVTVLAATIPAKHRH